MIIHDDFGGKCTQPTTAPAWKCVHTDKVHHCSKCGIKYMIDIFRVKEGSIRDWRTHGIVADNAVCTWTFQDCTLCGSAERQRLGGLYKDSRWGEYIEFFVCAACKRQIGASPIKPPLLGRIKVWQFLIFSGIITVGGIGYAWW